MKKLLLALVLVSCTQTSESTVTQPLTPIEACGKFPDYSVSYDGAPIPTWSGPQETAVLWKRQWLEIEAWKSCVEGMQ